MLFTDPDAADVTAAWDRGFLGGFIAGALFAALATFTAWVVVTL